MALFSSVAVRREMRTLITSRDAAARAYAASRLRKMGEKAKLAVPVLIHMLNDWTQLDHEQFAECHPYECTMPSKVAAQALVAIGEPAVEPLIAALKHQEDKVRWLAADALGQIRDPLAVEPLITALSDEDSNVHRAIPDALARIDPNWRSSEAARRMVPEFLRLLDDKNYLVRGGSAFALGVVRDTHAVRKLIEGLRDTRNGTCPAMQQRPSER